MSIERTAPAIPAAGANARATSSRDATAWCGRSIPHSRRDTYQEPRRYTSRGGGGDAAHLQAPIPAPAPAVRKAPDLVRLRGLIALLKPGIWSAAKITRTFFDQQQVGSGVVNHNDYREEVVAATTLAAFLYMPTGEHVPDIIHSLK